ncbi:MAG: DNA polymerase III subunit gamma/tau [Victivallaceae bacterium]|nr:DNA polymerase III subunit gamma/tau [Victivallaceae bacterium]
MSEYQVIARKWRPQRFADVVGQEHIVTTLKNAIRRQRTAHAYLFVGPRGIGKTTTARIFAKALNCEAHEDGEPCCKCNSCVSIANESNIDVREIDAASQNSVDSIRDLRDDAMHTPVSCRYKIYVIDEVHMLSKQAWNALLKTVEEPPPHVKFIFATTEVHQVLGTIISRCQRFDLQRISSRLICERLRKIADAEQVKISEIAIEAVARAADGGMRDGQSLLDQMIAFFGDEDEEISEEKVLSLFGLSTTDELESLITAVFVNNPSGVIAAVYNLSCRGKNLETLFGDLLSWLRAIQICGLIANPENILEDGMEMIGHYRKLAGQVNAELVQRLLEVLAPVGRTLHDAMNKQIFLESIILKAMRSAHAVQINDLINRLNQLRNKNELEVLDKLPSLAEKLMPQVVQTVQPNVGAASQPRTSQPEQPTVGADLRAANEVRPTVGADSRAANDNSKTIIPATKTTAPVVIETQSTEQGNVEDVAMKPTEPIALNIPSTEVDQSSSQDATPAAPEAPVIIDEEAVPVEVKSDAETNVIETDSAVAVMADELVEPQSFELEKQTPAELAAENAPPKPLTAQDVWHLMIQGFANHELANPQLKNYMIEATPETFDNSTLTVCFDDEYELEHYNAINDAMPLMNKLLQEVVDDWAAVINLQKRSGVRRLSDSTDEKKEVAEASADYDAVKSPMGIEISDEDETKSLFGHEEVMKKIENNDFVKYSVDLFGGRVVDVHG